MRIAALIMLACMFRVPGSAQRTTRIDSDDANATVNNINALAEYYNSFSNSSDKKLPIVNIKSPAKNNPDYMATSNNALLYETPVSHKNLRIETENEARTSRFNFDVYPNPSTNDATVAFDLGLQSTSLTIIVTNEQGKVVDEKDLNNISGYTRYHLPANVLGDGIYYVKVNIATDSYMKRLVMIK